MIEIKENVPFERIEFKMPMSVCTWFPMGAFADNITQSSMTILFKFSNQKYDNRINVYFS